MLPRPSLNPDSDSDLENSASVTKRRRNSTTCSQVEEVRGTRNQTFEEEIIAYRLRIEQLEATADKEESFKSLAI